MCVLEAVCTALHQWLPCRQLILGGAGGVVVSVITISIGYVAEGYTVKLITGLELISISIVFSYMRPCKSTIAKLSLSYHVMILGILSIAVHLWQRDLSTGTETLMETFIIIPIISHVLVFMWAMYTLINRIMFHLIHSIGLQSSTD